MGNKDRVRYSIKIDYNGNSIMYEQSKINVLL